ncbi:MAG: hypothetical protein ACD_2C00192G0003 [uncultured bacterium (gcode 4)]|uniref:Uncharacterized protein n=1 Tax=uncultured bacterium (gcode 4) TaxID=1234023 RepID=K2G266_9BACT|nr:MAG: hypothetical protein ACD_2C00192G0003 [uncultured bacterium (gcode 4)]
MKTPDKEELEEDILQIEEIEQSRLMEGLNSKVNISKVMFAYLILILVVFAGIWYYIGYWFLDKI